MIPGILIAHILAVLFGLMLGIICGIAVSWAANLWNDVIMTKEVLSALRFVKDFVFPK